MSRLAVLIACIVPFLAVQVAAGRAAAQADAVGEEDTAIMAEGRPITVAIRFPRPAPAGAARLPLVVVSHGLGGDPRDHLDTERALAAAGFVVAAPEHAGDNRHAHDEALHAWRRTAEIRDVVDFMTRRWHGGGAIAPGRIGVFGFSLGGFAALVSVGGVPDYRRIRPYCVHAPATFLCRFVRSAGALDMPLPGPAAWTHDPRIRAAVLAAPALGFAFGRDGLARVDAPVQLWVAADDTIVPRASTEAVRGDLPRPPEYHLVANADHADFTAPCTPDMPPHGCAERPGFDRAAFHARFDAAVVAFFRRTLAPPVAASP